MSGMKLVIFDLDGTLIDTVSLFVDTIRSVLETIGEPVPDEKTIRSISGLGVQVGIRRIAPALDDGKIDGVIELYRKETMARVKKSMQEEFFPGAMEALNILHGRQDIVMAVATGKPMASTNRILELHRVKGLFTSIHTPDTNIAKPDPDMILDAMAIVDVAPQRTVMIGDTTHDMEMAANAGSHGLGVSWGYHDPDELKAAGADMIIDDMDQLMPAIDILLESKNA